MVTMANNKAIETLNEKLADARRKLEHAEDEVDKAEGEVCKIKDNITAIFDKLETEALPTGLYNKGYALKEREHQFILSDRYGEELYSFNHVPTLGDLMDFERQYI